MQNRFFSNETGLTRNQWIALYRLSNFFLGVIAAFQAVDKFKNGESNLDSFSRALEANVYFMESFSMRDALDLQALNGLASVSRLLSAYTSHGIQLADIFHAVNHLAFNIEVKKAILSFPEDKPNYSPAGTNRY